MRRFSAHFLICILLLGLLFGFPSVKKVFAVARTADCTAGEANEIVVGNCSNTIGNDLSVDNNNQPQTGTDTCTALALRYGRQEGKILQATCQNWCTPRGVAPYDIPYDAYPYSKTVYPTPMTEHPEAATYCPRSATFPAGNPLNRWDTAVTPNRFTYGACPRTPSATNPADGACYNGSEPDTFVSAGYCCKYTEKICDQTPVLKTAGTCTSTPPACGPTGGTQTNTYTYTTYSGGGACTPVDFTKQDPCDVGTTNCGACQICNASGICETASNTTTGCTSNLDCSDNNACTIDTCKITTDVCGNKVGTCNLPPPKVPDGTKWDIPNNKVCCNGIETNNSSCTSCLVTTSPSVHNLNLGGTGAITATVTGLPAGRSIAQMLFGAYENPPGTIIATVNPTSDSASAYTTTVTAIATGNTAVWATAQLNDIGNGTDTTTCQSTAGTDTDINVGGPDLACGGTCIPGTNGDAANGKCWDYQTCSYVNGNGTCEDNLACVPDYVPPSQPVYIVTVNGRVLNTSTNKCYVGTVNVNIKADSGSYWAKSTQVTQNNENCSDQQFFWFAHGTYAGTYTLTIPNAPVGYDLTVSTATITVP